MVDGERPEGVALPEDAAVDDSVVDAVVEAVVEASVAAVDESAGAVVIGGTGVALLVTAESAAEDEGEDALDDDIDAADEAIGAVDETGTEEAFPEPTASGATDPPPYRREVWILTQLVWMVAI